MWRPQVVVSTQLTDDELDDMKVLCILQDKSIREWVTELIRKELRIRQETIDLARNAMPTKGQTLHDFLDERIPPRYKRKQREAPKLALLTDLAKGEVYE